MLSPALIQFISAVAVIAVSILLGNYLARRMRMADHGWRLGLILLTLLASVAIVGFRWPPKLGVDLKGGVKLIYEVDQASKDPNATVDMDKLIVAVGRRVNPGGQKEVTIRRYGPESIEIIVPDVEQNDVEQLKATLAQAGNLEFRILASRHYNDGPLIERAEKLTGDRVYDSSNRLVARWITIHETLDEQDNEKKTGELAYRPGPDDALRTKTVHGRPRQQVLVKVDPFNVTGLYLSGASKGIDESGAPEVDFQFNSTGAQFFGELTNQNLPEVVQGEKFPHKLGIVLDDELWSAPGIQSAIYDRGRITFGQQRTTPQLEREVNTVVNVLNAGALPAALNRDPLSETYSGPTLGTDTIQKAGSAMIVASILVPLFMLWYYRFAGIVANVALFLNMLMLLAIMISIRAAFTLTGFAGLALTVGMAVDNNVLVFERLREEMERGATLRMAIRNAFHRASATIIDCNLTHLLAATVLFFIGSDQLKGFAVTLWLGCAISMYTAVFVAHVIFEIAERRQWITQLKMLHMIRHTSIDFMGWFPICATASLLVTMLGLVIAGARQQGLFDIDFTGGVSVQVAFRDVEPAANIRHALEHLPDVAISDVHLQNEAPGKRFEINTSEQDLKVVKAELHKAFGDRMEANSVTLGPLTPILAASAAKPAAEKAAAAKPAVEKPAAEKATTEKPAAGKAPEKPAAKPAGKTSRNDLPADNVLALADEVPMLLLGAADAKPADKSAAEKPATGKPAAEKASEKPAAAPVAAKTEAPPPAAAKPAEPAAAGEPAAETFVGGSSVEVTFTHPVNHQGVSDMLADALATNKLTPDNVPYEITNPDYESELGSKAYAGWRIRIKLAADQARPVFATLEKQVKEVPYFPAATKIGGAVASNTRTQAVWALIASWCLIIVYLWIRFQRVAFGVAAVVALIHDVLVMLGAVAASYWLAEIPFVQSVLLIDQFKINLPIVAAFLTIIGYSVNDTIVVFDRIREVRGKDPNMTPKMINDSTNQTLSRTLLTSFTVFLVVIVLYIFGGQALRGFAFALIVGVATGTYSSIYVAAPILLWMIGKPRRIAPRQTEVTA